MTVRENIGTGNVMKERTWNWENIEGNLELGMTCREGPYTDNDSKRKHWNRECHEGKDQELGKTLKGTWNREYH
jgi:hypothetical protein